MTPSERQDHAKLVHLRQQLSRRFKDRWVALTAKVTVREIPDSWKRDSHSLTDTHTGWLGFRTLRTILSRRINNMMDGPGRPDWLGLWSDLLGVEVLEVHEYHFVRTSQV